MISKLRMLLRSLCRASVPRVTPAALAGRSRVASRASAATSPAPPLPMEKISFPLLGGATPRGWRTARWSAGLLLSSARENERTTVTRWRLYPCLQPPLSLGAVSPGGALPGYIAGPPGAPGVVALQEWWGVEENARTQEEEEEWLLSGGAELARRLQTTPPAASDEALTPRSQVLAAGAKLAAAGYRVLVPDLYKGKVGVNVEEASVRVLPPVPWPATPLFPYFLCRSLNSSAPRLSAAPVQVPGLQDRGEGGGRGCGVPQERGALTGGAHGGGTWGAGQGLPSRAGLPACPWQQRSS